MNVGLPQTRETVPRMVDVATRHPQLNLLSLEAVAAASTLEATIWLPGWSDWSFASGTRFGRHPLGNGPSRLNMQVRAAD
jgi:hypothetical protein